ncbi:MAG: HNH endonuclease [Deltaproteobacteria bacterium]|nr:MAG: HNH endonuclease [Deltaproteobacteria bacterium]
MQKLNATARRSLRPNLRDAILAKTSARCHVCGGPLRGEWVADHVRPRARGGRSDPRNYLPACYTCNGARWYRDSKVIRRMLAIAVCLLPDIRNRTSLGKDVLRTYRTRRQQNEARRRARK